MQTANPALMLRAAILACAAFTASAPALAGPDDFGPGPLIVEYGRIAAVDFDMAMPQDTAYQVAFDVAARSETDALNRTLTSAARFLNMHAANGVAAENLHLAVVIHGGAINDVTTASAGPNADLVAALLEHGVRLIVCGQTAAYYDVEREDLLPGVEMALSAMTAHALLQQSGYTLNPF